MCLVRAKKACEECSFENGRICDAQSYYYYHIITIFVLNLIIIIYIFTIKFIVTIFVLNLIIIIYIFTLKLHSWKTIYCTNDYILYMVSTHDYNTQLMYVIYIVLSHTCS